MKPIVFLDTDVILDILLERDGFAPALLILQMSADEDLTACTSSLTMVDIVRVLTEQVPNAMLSTLQQMLSIIEILPVDGEQFETATLLSGHCFEANLQAACAVRYNCTHIATRRPNAYRISAGELSSWHLPAIVTPEQL